MAKPAATGTEFSWQFPPASRSPARRPIDAGRLTDVVLPWGTLTGRQSRFGRRLRRGHSYPHVAVLFGNGSSTFSAPTTIPINFGSPVSAVGIVASDFNNDGKLDLAVGYYFGDTIAVLMGNGHGGFSAPTYYAVNGKGPPPGILTAMAISTWLRPHYEPSSVAFCLAMARAVSPRPVLSMASITTLVCHRSGDFNADGKLDLAIANQGMGGGNGSIKVLWARQRRFFRPPFTSSALMATTMRA